MSTNALNLVPKVWSDIPAPPRREALWIKEGKKCHWCQKPTRLVNDQSWDMATVEHLIPRFKGGTNDPENLVSACWRCNNRRSHEDNLGLPDGSLLGQYKTKTERQNPNYKPKYIALTADEKKAVLNKMQGHPIKVQPEDVLREQRDQALKEIVSLRKELKHYEAVVKDQEQKLKTMTVWTLIRQRLADWLRP